MTSARIVLNSLTRDCKSRRLCNDNFCKLKLSSTVCTLGTACVFSTTACLMGDVGVWAIALEVMDESDCKSNTEEFSKRLPTESTKDIFVHLWELVLLLLFLLRLRLVLLLMKAVELGTRGQRMA